jgi:ATP-dependent Clp protease ATP-binding subunit ClpA
MEEEKMAEFE